MPEWLKAQSQATLKIIALHLVVGQDRCDGAGTLTQELQRREAYLAEVQRLSHTGLWLERFQWGDVLVRRDLPYF